MHGLLGGFQGVLEGFTKVHRGVSLGFKGSRRVSSSIGVLGFRGLKEFQEISEDFNQGITGGSTEFGRFKGCFRDVSKGFRGSQEHTKGRQGHFDRSQWVSGA